jgi:hypothetical protein
MGGASGSTGCVVQARGHVVAGADQQPQLTLQADRQAGRQGRQDRLQRGGSKGEVAWP